MPRIAAITLILLGIPATATNVLGQTKDLTERYCKDEAIQGVIMAEMNQEPILRAPLRVERLAFAYLETARKPYFCAYMVNDEYLFAATPISVSAGKRRFKFDFLD